MATVDPVEITPTLQNCSITEPAKSSDGKYYLDPSHMTVTLKADTGFIFKNDGKLTYQQTEYAEGDLVIKATGTDTATVSLPADIDWNNQFSFPLTISAVKAPTTTPTTPTTTPTTGGTTGSTGSTGSTTQPTTKTPTTQLDVLKSSLRIPNDLTDDDSLLQGYLDAATEYLKSTLDEENVATRLNSTVAKVAIVELATLYYQNRGDNVSAKDWPFSLRVLINSLRYKA